MIIRRVQSAQILIFSKDMPMKSGAIAAGHPETAIAARTILEEGGNAFDAVLGAMAASCVTEPVLSSMGGGGFLMARPAGRAPMLYDFFAQTPKVRPDLDNCDFHPILCDFGTVQQEFHIGMASIATPGAVKGLFQVSQELGRMPLARVIEPALALARDGFLMNALQAYIFEVVGGIYMSTGPSRAIFASPEDPKRLIGEGEMMSNQAFADALENIIHEGEELFYRGEIAAKIAADCESGGGTLTRADLESYEVRRRFPLVRDYHGTRLYTNPPPSSGGILIGFALALLDDIDVGRMGFGSAEHLGLLTAIMELTNLARVESCVHDQDEADSEEILLNSDLLDKYRKKVLGHPRAQRGTTHISVVDSHGNAASLTLSNGEGAGYVVPDTGIMLNNMLGEEDINPHGFHHWPTDKRMCSMMAPTIAIRPDGELFALGSGGSNRIRTAILQVLINLLDFEMPIEGAVSAPRLHFESNKLNIENGFDEDTRRTFASKFDDAKLWGEKNLFFGGVHAVRLGAKLDNFDAVGDFRRGGSALVI